MAFNYLELMEAGVLCDLTLIEKTAAGETVEHSVHKLVMYTTSPYFKALFDQQMGDKDTNVVTIETEATEPVLELVLKAMYSKPARVESIYYTYTAEHSIQEIMQLYMICTYLQLDEHTKYIQTGIKENIQIADLTKWWRLRQENGLEMPVGVDTMVQKYLQASLKYLGGPNEAYISVKALLNLWPDIDDLVSNSVREFLSDISNIAIELNLEGNDDPNEWMSDDIIPKDADHPELHSYDSDSGRWIDPESKFIFVQSPEKKWYVNSRLDSSTQFATELTFDDKKFARRKGWFIKK